MAGKTNNEQLEALQRLRLRTCGQDPAIAAWASAAAEVAALDTEVDKLRADYESKLAALRSRRDEARRRSDELLCQVADDVGDDHATAELLGVALRHVRDARHRAGGGGISDRRRRR